MNCLDENTVVAYVEGLLPQRETKQVEDHLDTCPSCRQAVLEVAGASDTMSPPTLQAATTEAAQEQAAARWLEEAPGRYAIRGERGRGGQARVYTAYDAYMGREVALKALLPSGQRDSTREQADSVARFMREVRIAGQLTHPSVVNVYELGRRADGSLYYTMELVRGQTLAAMLAACENLEERLGLLPHFIDICNGIAYAHSRGVLHRDLKPANIMIGEFGETVVLDWGLASARATTDDPAATVAGTALGTPAYMSPEQANGDVAAIDERTDVWGLGAILFEILTGRAPFEGNSSGEIIRRAQEETVAAVREVHPAAPAALAAVADRALSRESGQRYASAKELAADVGAYLSGRRVEAHAYGLWELLRLFAGRHVIALTAGVVVALAVLAALVVVWISYQSELDARRAEQEERRTASFHLAQAYADRAGQALKKKDRLSARILAAASNRNNPAHAGSPLYAAGFLKRHPQSGPLRLTADSIGYLTRYRWFRRRAALLPLDTASHGIVLLADGRIAAGTVGGTLAVWPEDGAEPLFAVQAHDGGINRIAASPDGKWLATCGKDGTTGIHDARTGTRLHTFRSSGSPFYSAVFSPDGKTLVTTDLGDEILLWDVSSGKLRRRIRHAPPGSKTSYGPALALAFSPDGKHIATGGAYRDVLIWTADGDHLMNLADHDGPGIFGLAFSPDGKLLASGGMDQTVVVWDAASGKHKHTLSGFEADFFGLTFSPDSQRLAAGGHDGTIHLWDAGTGERLGMVHAHDQIVYSLSFSADGRRLASAGFDRCIKIWEMATPLPAIPLTRANASYASLAFSPDGQTLAGGDEVRFGLWDVAGRKLVRTLEGDWPGIEDVAWSADGKRIALGGSDGALWVFDAGTGKAVLSETLDKYAVSGVAFNPEGDRLVSAESNGRLRIWHLAEKKMLTERQVCQVANDVRFSPDGKLIAVPCLAEGTRLVRASDLSEVLHLSDDDNRTLDVDFSPDGRRLAAGRMDGSITVRETATGKLLATLTGHTNRVHCVTWAPDGRTLAGSSRDQTVRLWSAGTWEPLLALPAASSVFTHDFSPDGKLLAYGDVRGVSLIPLDLSSLAADPASLLATAQADAGMHLDGYELVPNSTTRIHKKSP